ncbi:DUF6233 domain-containing protein [Streptomyces hayashii]|uniref:DUF6233 domain-containing protein n=1 Tax=Streptomyces hayashii TaxID=2839966 RepID=UPI00403C5A96
MQPLQLPNRRTYSVTALAAPRCPQSAAIHVADCPMTEGAPQPINGHEARAPLADPHVTACASHRPDTGRESAPHQLDPVRK